MVADVVEERGEEDSGGVVGCGWVGFGFFSQDGVGVGDDAEDVVVVVRVVVLGHVGVDVGVDGGE